MSPILWIRRDNTLSTCIWKRKHWKKRMKEPEQQNKTKDKTTTTTTTSLNHNRIKLFVTVLDRCAMFGKICTRKWWNFACYSTSLTRIRHKNIYAAVIVLRYLCVTILAALEKMKQRSKSFIQKLGRWKYIIC